MDELVCYDQNLNKFLFMRNEEKALLLQNILSELVDFETWEGELPEAEQFKFFKDFEWCNNSDVKIIKLLYYKISKDYDKDFKINHINIIDYSYLMIDYNCLTSINFILISFIKDFLKDEDKLKQILYKDFAGVKFNSSQLKYYAYFDDFETIKTIHFNFAHKTYERYINLEYIYFFCIFFKFLFPHILNVEFNFNSEKINQFFYFEKNPYRMLEKSVIKLGRKNVNILFTNYMLTRLLSTHNNLQNLKFRVLDSYIIELNDNIINNISILEGEFHFNNFIYITNLLQLTNVLCLNCEFNSLDSVLFEKINFLLIKNISIESLSLNLFPSEVNNINLRKIFLNECYSRNSFQVNMNDIDNDELYIDFIELDNVNFTPESISIMKDETILKFLFKSFNENLKKLTVIIESKIKKLKYLKIFITPHKQLLEFQEFNCILGSFIFNIFKILNTNKKSVDLIEFKLNVPNFTFDYNILQFYTDKSFNLNNLKLADFSLGLPLGNLIQIKQFPKEYLSTLELSYLSVKDFIKINKFFMENQEENSFHRLILLSIKLSINLDENEFNDAVLNFFTIQKPLNLEKIIITVRNKINSENLNNILEKIKINKNKDKIKEYNIHAPSLNKNILYNQFSFFTFKSKSGEIHTLKINKLFLHKIFNFIFTLKYSKLPYQKLFEFHSIRIKVCEFLFTRRDKKINLYEI